MMKTAPVNVAPIPKVRAIVLTNAVIPPDPPFWVAMPDGSMTIKSSANAKPMATPIAA
jgi:hypothetical protein